jgi:hypothetical protein
MKRFYFNSDILGMKLIRSTLKDVLNIILFDKDRICVFEANKELKIQFNKCVDSINIDKILLSITMGCCI